MDIRAGLVPLIVVLFFWNMITPSIINNLDDVGKPEHLFVIGFVVGTVLGQGVLLALWGALGIEPVAKRVLRCMSLLLFGCLAWILGFKLTGDAMNVEVSVVVIAVVLGGFSITMTPLFLLRRFTNWCIYAQTPTNERSQFAIRDLFLWTAVIAVQIALAKLAMKDQSFTIRLSANDINQIGLALFALTGGLIVVGLPTAFAAFGKSRRFALFVVVALFVTPPVVFEFLILVMGGRPSARNYFEVCFAMFSTGLGVVTTMFGVIRIVRQFDYRLGSPTSDSP